MILAIVGYVAVAVCFVVYAIPDSPIHRRVGSRLEWTTGSIAFASVLWLPALLAAVTMVAIDAAAARRR